MLVEVGWCDLYKLEIKRHVIHFCNDTQWLDVMVLSDLNFSGKLLTIAAIYYFNRSEYPIKTSPMKAAAPPNAAPTAVHSFTITTI